MRKSLALKLIFWNSLFLLLAMGVFGVLQLWNTQRTIGQMVDRDLTTRAMSIPVNGRPGGQGEPGFGSGRPRPEENPDPNFRRQGPNPSGPPPERNPWRRPRVFSIDGDPMGQADTAVPFDQSALSRSLKGQVVFLNKTVDGTELRIGSFPRRDGSRLIGAVQLAQEVEPFRIAARAQSWSLLLIIPLTALVSIGLIGLLTKVVVKPILLLTKAAEKVANQPDQREQIPVSGNDEIARLTGSFNQMTASLQDANEEISTALDRQKRFTSDAAHELRTPLTSISLAAENGLHHEATPDERRASLETILRSSESMNRLTQVLLTLARLDARESLLDCSNIPIRSLVTSVISEARWEGDPRIQVEIDSAMTAWANPDGLKQLIRNLVENALAYTPTEGSVVIKVIENQLIVRDTGTGIAPQHLPHLFERFYRGDPSRDRKTGGHGLGLAIVKALADAMGASIAVESQVGQGTTFFVRFAKNAESS